jgi:hypothetical protein
MKTIRFLAAARRELLAEVLHYNEMEVGLGVKFARAFEQALALSITSSSIDRVVLMPSS